MFKVPFTKMQSYSNDFVVIEEQSVSDAKLLFNDLNAVAKICNRKQGIGCDQLLLISNIKEESCTMRVYNSDTSESNICLNGTASIGMLLMQKYNKDKFTIVPFSIPDRPFTVTKQISQPIELEHKFGSDMQNNHVMVTFPALDFGSLPLPTIKPASTFSEFLLGELPVPAIGITVGNYHLVFFVDEEKQLEDIDKFATKVRQSNIFSQAMNVSVCYLRSEYAVRCRVIEAGAGETESCGSAAAAIHLAAEHHCNRLLNNLEITFNGGTVKSGRCTETHRLYLLFKPVEVFSGTFGVKYHLTSAQKITCETL